jgi:hypothetical protein
LSCRVSLSMRSQYNCFWTPSIRGWKVLWFTFRQLQIMACTWIKVYCPAFPYPTYIRDYPFALLSQN